MLLYFIRHGDPIYFPDSLTQEGEKQAEALSHRLARVDFNKIYTSTSNRAILTAKPTCEALNMDYTELAWCDERYAGEEFMAYDSKNNHHFISCCDNYRKLFASKEIEKLGFEWYNHSAFADKKCKEGMNRILVETEKFIENLGYKHNREERCYDIVRANDDKIALFAHAGFGGAFLSCLLDIPYPMLASRMIMSHSTVTVIEFPNDDVSIPKILTFSNDSHLYKENLSTKWCNLIDI